MTSNVKTQKCNQASMKYSTHRVAQSICNIWNIKQCTCTEYYCIKSLKRNTILKCVLPGEARTTEQLVIMSRSSQGTYIFAMCCRLFIGFAVRHCIQCDVMQHGGWVCLQLRVVSDEMTFFVPFTFHELRHHVIAVENSNIWESS